jgi:predicted component of type VI protein secretion system
LDLALFGLGGRHSPLPIPQITRLALKAKDIETDVWRGNSI